MKKLSKKNGARHNKRFIQNLTLIHNTTGKEFYVESWNKMGLVWDFMDNDKIFIRQLKKKSVITLAVIQGFSIVEIGWGNNKYLK